MKHLLIVLGVAALWPGRAGAQSADWQSVIWREPQVRYLLADMTLGGSVTLYRDYATRERDPDSVEAIRLWDAGSRVVNTNDFERRWVTNKYGKDGRVMRVVLRGTNRTITGNEVLLSSDLGLDQPSIRLILLELCLGREPSEFGAGRPAFSNSAAVRPQPLVRKRDTSDPSVAEALRRWRAGVRVANVDWFAWGMRKEAGPNFRGSNQPADGLQVFLNSDLLYPETNVRYFMADIALGGSIEFYRAAAERDHEMGCLEAVRRTEDGYQITNLDQFERKKVDGKTLITRKGSNERISGMEVKLSSD